MKPTLLLSLATAALLPLTAVRAAFDQNIVADDARWVVHVDLNHLRESVLGKELIAIATQSQKEATHGMIGVDIPKLLETIGTATAYGSNFSKDPNAIDGTIVIRGTPELRTIIEGFLVQGTISTPANITELTDLPFPAYLVSSNGGVIIAIPPEPIVLVSKSKARLLKARDIARGAAPSIAQAENSPLKHLLDPARDAYVFAATAVPSDELFSAETDGPHARILKMADSLSLALGETGPNTFAHAQLIAPDAAMADKLMKILQGMTAMLSLAETSDRALADFINSTSVTRQGNMVTLHLAYASTRLIEMAKSIHAQGPKVQAHADRPAQNLVSGTALAEWTAEDVGDAPSAPATRTVENVELQNGATLSLARALNGGRASGFTQVEIVPAAGGPGLTFTPDMMTRRDRFQQFKFPGATGRYTLHVRYVNDGSGKATYAISIRQPEKK